MGSAKGESGGLKQYMRLIAAMTAVLGGAIILTSGQTAHAATEQQQSNANTKPETSQKFVTVQSGDYLIKIAESNNTTAERLFFANTDIQNPDLIYPDQKLRVPTADEQLTTREVPVNQTIEITPQQAVRAAAPAAKAPAPQQQAVAPAPTGSGCEWLRGRLAANGLTDAEIPSALAIASSESGCNPRAVNRISGACNVFQELTCGKWGGLSDVDAHIRGASGYAKARYGGWVQAYAYWQAHHWW